MKMFYYSNMAGRAGWFTGMNGFRAKFGEGFCVRCSHKGIAPPKGWHKPNGELGGDAIERIPTVRDLIHQLTRH